MLLGETAVNPPVSLSRLGAGGRPGASLALEQRLRSLAAAGHQDGIQLGKTGGTNAVLANCSVGLADRPESAGLAKLASVNFICSPEEARRRIKRVEQLGFEEILIGSQFGALDEIERMRDFL